jgi:hypothetical protein
MKTFRELTLSDAVSYKKFPQMIGGMELQHIRKTSGSYFYGDRDKNGDLGYTRYF